MQHEVDDAVGFVSKARSPDSHRVWKSALRRAVSRVVAGRVFGVLVLTSSLPSSSSSQAKASARSSSHLQAS